MSETAIVIPQGQLRNYLDTIEIFPQISAVSCDASIYEDEATTATMSSRQLHCPIVMNLLPEDAVTAFQTAESIHSVNLLIKNIKNVMNTAAAQNGTRFFTIPIRLDRISNDDWDEQLDLLVSYMTRILIDVMPYEFSCLIPVRFPKAFPTSCELERAKAVCQAVNEQINIKRGLSNFKATMGICAIVYPDEKQSNGQRITPETFQQDNLLADIGAIMFNYSPAAGETLFDDEQTQWADFLKDASFDGVVLFNPIAVNNLEDTCQDISDWMEMYE